MWRRVVALLLTATTSAGCEKVKATFDPAAGPRATLAKAQQFVETCDMQGFSQLLAPHLRTRLDEDTIARMESNCRKDQEAGTQNIHLMLQTARRLKTRFEKNDTLAIYDLKGYGFPKNNEEVRLMKIGDEWFITGT